MLTSPGTIRNLITSLRRSRKQIRLPKGSGPTETNGIPRDQITLSKAGKHKLPLSQEPNRPLNLGLSGSFVLIGAIVGTATASLGAGIIFLLPAAFCFGRAFYKPK
jgi:hypothetical protein